ncbi:MAG: helix-turn-helix transcriptional regulator [Comamonadaceae bacterium]|jgi:transcriptional regulator with XRE-family HTH domain|uniref:XRE family transcriptional regulator n=1 Tax=Hydrogenophaga borbori TaxID=2294117 RepID=A0A372EMG2_9BURK|nr:MULTISPECIES: helix-turn-helix transcriptional regulator [Hydrogenophaga]NCT99748.1 helix-turn-helix transcriptional regulator [Comamonadaceae bacterium]RFP80485.1 XRE family transcriptional regulator [Hydrogenophaga borbori]WQB84426.1 helix-turn-helix transcriptional regulator [Hydrogenophaga sp. SNF1]
MIVNMGILDDLEAARKASSLTQAELAERAGVNRMTVGRLEAGLDPRLSTLQELARALGLELMLVPRELRPAIDDFVRAGGRLVAQPAGVGAPQSVVDLLVVPAPAPGKPR